MFWKFYCGYSNNSSILNFKLYFIVPLEIHFARCYVEIANHISKKTSFKCILKWKIKQLGCLHLNWSSPQIDIATITIPINIILRYKIG